MWLREGGGTKGERSLERQTEANHKALSQLGRKDLMSFFMAMCVAGRLELECSDSNHKLRDQSNLGFHPYSVIHKLCKLG